MRCKRIRGTLSELHIICAFLLLLNGMTITILYMLRFHAKASHKRDSCNHTDQKFLLIFPDLLVVVVAWGANISCKRANHQRVEFNAKV